MTANRIEFIAAYCDRWCERCAFTDRCSVYAVETAIAMCGDVEEGLELARGDPRPAKPWEAGESPPGLRDHLAAIAMPEGSAAVDGRLKARRAHLEATSVMQGAWAYTMLVHDWLDRGEYGSLAERPDAILKDALAVVRHDQILITVKLSRAMNGRDRHIHGNGLDVDDPRADWNGSAKVALLSIERSEAAWRALASCTPAAGTMASHLARLRDEVDREFPAARRFIRPGFDEPRP